MRHFLAKLCGLAVIAALLATGTGYAQACKGKSQVLFEYQFTNMAWGYACYGWFVDSTGNVKCYRLTKSTDSRLHRPDADGYISAAELAENFSRATEKAGAIPCAELHERAAGMDVLLCNSVILAPEHVRYDAGAWEFFCYVWDSERGKYKRILLSKDGDIRQINSHPKAVELTKWLADINRTYFGK